MIAISWRDALAQDGLYQFEEYTASVSAAQKRTPLGDSWGIERNAPTLKYWSGTTYTVARKRVFLRFRP